MDRAALDAALDAAMGTEEQNTRALAVVRHGKIVGERYAPGFTRNTPQISWSEGKSVTATLIGVLMQKGHFGLDDPAPVAEWRAEGDPRGVILMRHLLTMSSGLDMTNLGLGGASSLIPENEHMRVYFDSLNVFEHASGQPYGIPPGTEFRYRNSDPLTLGRIVRETVENNGKEYLTHPQRMLFDRIGSRDFVLEPDPWGNFILSGYEYGSAADWMRFGLLHLWDGVFEGDRILPEGWSEFVSSPSPGAQNGEYGGLWWLNLGGRHPDIPSDAYWASGFMGQTTMVIPSRDIVVVRLGPEPRRIRRVTSTPRWGRSWPRSTTARNRAAAAGAPVPPAGFRYLRKPVTRRILRAIYRGRESPRVIQGGGALPHPPAGHGVGGTRDGRRRLTTPAGRWPDHFRSGTTRFSPGKPHPSLSVPQT